MFFYTFNNKTAEELNEEALKTFINANYKKSAKLFNKTITAISDNDDLFAELYYNLAIINKNLNQTKKAINNINKAIEIKDDNFNFYFERAEIKDLLNDNSSEKDREKAYYLLKGYLSDDDYVEVLKVMSYPSDIRDYANDFTAMYLKINNHIKLIEYINRIIKIYNEDISLLDLKTDILSKINHLPEAIETITKAIKINPKCGHYYLMRGGLYYNLNQFNEAKSDIEKALTFELSETDKFDCNEYLKYIEGNI